MSDFKTEIKYVVEVPFNYSAKGDQHEAQFVTLTAPAAKHSRECAALKQAFFRALPKDAEAKEGAEPGEVTGAEVLVLLAMSVDVELPEVIEIGKKLLAGGVALVDGETKLTANLIDNMMATEFESMLGEYIVNFILASSLPSTKEA